MAIGIQVDRENDQLYLRLRDEAASQRVAKTIPLADGVLADLDGEGRLVGLDFTEASRALGLQQLDDLAIAVSFGGSRVRAPE